MKKILYITYFILISFICFSVSAKNDILTYNKTINNDYKIDYILDTKDGYITINDNILSSYIDDKLIAQKEFPDITKLAIIPYQDKYLLVGIDNNNLNIYLIDKYLKVSLSNLSNTITNFNNLKLYSKDNKVYILDLNKGSLNSTTIYEIDENLTIKENNFSTYSALELHNILNSTYYMIHQDGTTTDNKTSYYLDSTYTIQYNILVGYYLNSDSSTTGLINILDNDGQIIKTITEQVPSFTSVKIINNTIVALTKDNTNTYLYLYDIEGNLIDKIILNNMTHIKDIYRISNHLYLIDNESSKTNIYDFNCTITKDEDIYGTVNIASSMLPNEKVKIDIIPNSGYEVDKIEVKDYQGNIIPLTSTSFTMPNKDVYVSISYKEVITNPETNDILIIILFIGIIFTFTTFYFVKKVRWLK